jgi:hypothetical protein
MAECYKVAALDGLNKLSLWAEAESTACDTTPALDLASQAVAEAILV